MDTRISTKTSVVVAVIAAVLAVLGAPAAAAPPDDITEYPLPTADSHPYGIAAGPDGNLWFTEQGGNRIGRITPAGTITEFPAFSPAPGNPGYSGPHGIAAGPDGNMWFTEPGANKIGRITPAGTITEFPVPTANSGLLGIAAGPDGNLWFAEGNAHAIGRITPDGTITEFTVFSPGPGYPGYGGPVGITAGPDGNMWFTGAEAFGIGRITPTGTATIVAGTMRESVGIAAGPDGNLWFPAGDWIWRITPAGTKATPFRVPDGAGGEITAGPDGNMWFTETGLNRIGRITPSGAISQYPLPSADSRPAGIAAGPDGNLWFTESQANKIGRISPKATPMVVKRPCPVNVTLHMPTPTKIGSRIFTDRITTKKSSCVLRRPVVRCRLVYNTPDAKKPFCNTKVSKRGKIRVITKGDEVYVTVIVRAYPKRGFADRWKGHNWRKMWYLG